MPIDPKTAFLGLKTVPFSMGRSLFHAPKTNFTCFTPVVTSVPESAFQLMPRIFPLSPA